MGLPLQKLHEKTWWAAADVALSSQPSRRYTQSRSCDVTVCDHLASQAPPDAREWRHAPAVCRSWGRGRILLECEGESWNRACPERSTTLLVIRTSWRQYCEPVKHTHVSRLSADVCCCDVYTVFKPVCGCGRFWASFRLMKIRYRRHEFPVFYPAIHELKSRTLTSQNKASSIEFKTGSSTGNVVVAMRTCRNHDALLFPSAHLDFLTFCDYHSNKNAH